jgi:hypothetical protein
MRPNTFSAQPCQFPRQMHDDGPHQSRYSNRLPAVSMAFQFQPVPASQTRLIACFAQLSGRNGRSCVIVDVHDVDGVFFVNRTCSPHDHFLTAISHRLAFGPQSAVLALPDATAGVRRMLIFGFLNDSVPRLPDRPWLRA